MRIWLDRLLSEHHSRSYLDKLIGYNFKLVVDASAMDFRVFQNHVQWFESRLKCHDIDIELSETPGEMVKNGFYWNSCSRETKPSVYLEMAVRGLPNADAILKVSELIEEYGIRFEVWNKDNRKLPEMNEAVCNMLRIHKSVAPEVLYRAAAAKMRVDLYSWGYAQKVAKWHNCDAILEIGNGITTLFV